MQPLITEGFHHVTLVATDTARSAGFYRDLLGLGLLERAEDPDAPGAHHLYFGAADGSPGTLLTVQERPGATRGAWGVGGVHHVALGVEDEAGLLKWKRRLTDHGVPVTGPYDRGWFHSIYFTDADGQIVEIATHGPGYDLDEPMDALGELTVQPRQQNLSGLRDEAAIRARTHPEPVPEVTPDMALTGIHHVSGITDSVERAHEFYTGALGLRIVKRTVNQDAPGMPHWFWANYDGARVLPHSAMTLFGIPRGKRAREGAGQLHHVAFRARDDAELAAWSEHLRSLGVEVGPVRDRAYWRSISFRAPDGQLLEIATDGPGFRAG